MSSGPSRDCHEAKLMEKQDPEEKKTMMMVMMEDDGSYPVRDQNEEDEEKKLSLEVAVEEDTMMGAIETDLIFCDDAFPSLPDFPCLSSPSNAACPSSSSSSNSSSSSASSTTWAQNRQGEHHHRHQHADGQASSSAIIGDIPMKKDPLGSMDSDCSIYQLEGIDLLGSADESWDPFSLFPDEGGTNDLNENEALFQEREDIILQHGNLEEERDREEGDCTSQELASVFLEWLRTNKEAISPEDLRSIKLRRSTIESAARSLGGGKDGMKKLLKLILNWVQSNHLQRKRTRLSPSSPDLFNEEDLDIAYLYQQAQLSDLQEGNIQSNPCEAPYMGASPAVQPFSPPSICSWSQQMPQYPLPSLYNQYEPSFSRLGSSATKEARKKRMARQRRFSSIHHSQNLQPHQRNRHLQSSHDEHQSNPALPGERICSQRDNHGSWGFPSSASSSSQQVVVNGGATATSMSQQRLHDFPPGNTQDKRQGWRAEKNLRFLLQKVLKQSDVGSLGRIVLPKKEAETHLPELETRDGITLAMEDIVTSRTWNMRYRFWPNNKSRMYLLENTGEFVRSNGLQEGDFIVIYSDMKCGKYMIRGVKVRHSADPNISGTTEPGTGR